MKQNKRIFYICVEVLLLVLSFIPIIKYSIAVTQDVISVNYYSMFYLLVIMFSRAFIFSAVVEILRDVVLVIKNKAKEDFPELQALQTSFQMIDQTFVPRLAPNNNKTLLSDW